MMEKHGCQKELSKINLEEFLYGEHVGKEEFLTDCPKFTLEDVLSEFQRGSFNPEKILIILEKNLLANQETPGTLDILLQIASQKGELALVKKLMEKGADPKAQGSEALISAADKGHLDVVKWLAEKGADPKAQDSPALNRAALNGHVDVVEWLLEKGADPMSISFQFSPCFLLENSPFFSKIF